MYPKVPAGLTAVRHGGVLSLPGTDNLRALPMVKYFSTVPPGMGEPCHLLFTLSRTAVEVGLGSEAYHLGSPLGFFAPGSLLPVSATE